VGEELRKLAITPINSGVTGEVHRDRFVLRRDLPLASNNLRELAARTLLKDVAERH
jgi:molecular chaperone Hsp31 and glyoxalase 3